MTLVQGVIVARRSVTDVSVCFRVLKEQWIRAKYERQEFIEDGKKPHYEDGTCASDSHNTPFLFPA